MPSKNASPNQKIASTKTQKNLIYTVLRSLNLILLMRIITYTIILMFLACSQDQVELPQVLIPEPVVHLPQEMLEISGMIYNNNHTIYAHNDSGNSPKIFELSLEEQKVLQTISISNAENIDWEDIADDDDFIYVGDFGNNLGARENLVIYIINKNEVATQDSVVAEIISFSYPEQIDFMPSNQHNFDCEAMLVFRDELFLFTKNRIDQKTHWYSLPKVAGEYPAQLRGDFDTRGFLTAATISDSKDCLLYTSPSPRDATLSRMPSSA